MAVKKIFVCVYPEWEACHVAVIVELSYVKVTVGFCGVELVEGHHIGAYRLVGIFADNI